IAVVRYGLLRRVPDRPKDLHARREPLAAVGGLPRKIEIRGQDAHDGVGGAAQGDLAAYHRGIGAKTAPPQRIGNQHHLALSAMVLLLFKQPAETRSNAKHVEEVSGKDAPRDQLGRAAASEAEGGVAIGTDTLKGLGVLAPLHKLADVDGKRPAITESR